MKLFDKIVRSNDRPADYAEPKFIYLNNSARPEVGRIRDTLEEWFSRYPRKESLDLQRRFQSVIDSQHQGAFFELFLHELLKCLNCKVKVHPKISEESTKRPDFFVKCPTGSSFYMEAVIATDESQGSAAEEARKNKVYDTLNRLDSPYFFVGMEQSGSPRTSPPGRKVGSSIKQWLDTLNPDEVVNLFRNGGWAALPRFRYDHAGWRLAFVPIPKRIQSRGKPGLRTVAMKSTGIQIIEPWVAIRDAIVRKAGRYGIVGVPYVVAVNAIKEQVSSEKIRRMHIMEALFGKEQYKFNRYRSPSGEMVRRPDGVWTSKGGPRYTRLSAVLVAAPIHHWNVPNTPVCLYHNPWTTSPYRSELTRLPQAIPQPDERIKWQEGVSIERILGFPKGWPNI